MVEIGDQEIIRVNGGQVVANGAKKISYLFSGGEALRYLTRDLLQEAPELSVCVYRFWRSQCFKCISKKKLLLQFVHGIIHLLIKEFEVNASCFDIIMP